MNTLYLDAASGISGDMTVGALLDLGGSWEKVQAVLASMPFDGYNLVCEKIEKGGFKGTSFDVILHHAHAHSHAHVHEHHHAHRNLADVKNVIQAGRMTAHARELAFRAFDIVAAAEAKAHGTTIDAVHFHEVGAVDSICDIVAASVLFDDLGIAECIVTELGEGSGTIVCAHGEMQVPVPAVRNIAEAFDITLQTGRAQTELVTPTGIALAATFRTQKELPPNGIVVREGRGFGKRDIGRPSFLRAALMAWN